MIDVFFIKTFKFNQLNLQKGFEVWVFILFSYTVCLCVPSAKLEGIIQADLSADMINHYCNKY